MTVDCIVYDYKKGDIKKDVLEIINKIRNNLGKPLTYGYIVLKSSCYVFGKFPREN